MGEPFAVTMEDNPLTVPDETGGFRLADLPPDAYLVREIVPVRYRQTFPAQGSHFVQLGTGQTVNNVNFGNQQLGVVIGHKWSDVDGDGWVDLLVALDWGGVSYFRNNAGHGFEDRSVSAGFAAAGTGLWTSLASADFNGDGRPDFVAGNLGWNTPWTASIRRPRSGSA